jgi:alkylation response protein AidB-like acyl-CoA dehydrogenase
MSFNLDTTFALSSGSEIVERVIEAARVIAKSAAARDAERILIHDEMRQIADTGALGIRVPIELGGTGGSLSNVIQIIFEIAKGDPNAAQVLLPHFAIVERLIVLGKPCDRERYSSVLLKNSLFGGAFAERGGKFVGDMKVALATTPDGYRLSGTKHYSTGAIYGDYIVTAAGDTAGNFYFVIMEPDRQGIKLLDDWNGMGQRLTGSGTTIFDDVTIGPDDLTLIDTADSRSNYLGAYSQLTHAAIDAGIAAAALSDARAIGRRIGRPLPQSGVEHSYDDPYVLHAVGELAMWTNIGIAMIERAAGLLDKAAEAYLANTSADGVIAAAVVAAAEARAATDAAAMKLATGLYSVAGASAVDRSLNLDRHWRNARTHLQHDPIAYKYKTIGDYYLNGKAPPNSAM